MALFYERAVKRKITPTLLVDPFFGSQPTTYPSALQLAPAHLFTLTTARPLFWRSCGATIDLTFLEREAPTIVLSETSTQLESSPTTISGRAGGHTAYASSLGAAWFGAPLW